MDEQLRWDHLLGRILAHMDRRISRIMGLLHVYIWLPAWVRPRVAAIFYLGNDPRIPVAGLADRRTATVVLHFKALGAISHGEREV